MAAALRLWMVADWGVDGPTVLDQEGVWVLTGVEESLAGTWLLFCATAIGRIPISSGGVGTGCCLCHATETDGTGAVNDKGMLPACLVSVLGLIRLQIRNINHRYM